MTLYLGHVPISGPCPYIWALYLGHVPISGPCPYIWAMSLYLGPISGPCPYIWAMSLYLTNSVERFYRVHDGGYDQSIILVNVNERLLISLNGMTNAGSKPMGQCSVVQCLTPYVWWSSGLGPYPIRVVVIRSRTLPHMCGGYQVPCLTPYEWWSSGLGPYPIRVVVIRFRTLPHTSGDHQVQDLTPYVWWLSGPVPYRIVDGHQV